MTTENISYIGKATENPDNILSAAIGVYDSVLIIGYNKDGKLDPRTSAMSPKDLLWLITQFQRKLVNGDYEE